MICLKTQTKAKLEAQPVSFSGDSMAVCSQCKMTEWHVGFGKFHIESEIEDDKRNIPNDMQKFDEALDNAKATLVEFDIVSNHPVIEHLIHAIELLGDEVAKLKEKKT